MALRMDFRYASNALPIAIPMALSMHSNMETLVAL